MRAAAATADAAAETLSDRLRTCARPAAGLVLAAAAALVVALFAKAEHETLAMTEGRFLALEIGLVLASVGWLGRSFLPQLAAGATVFAALALPALPTRSAIVLFLLLAFWLLAAAPLALRKSPSLADFFFVALGLQALARPDLLLGPWGPRSAALVLLPALAALALFYLAERYGNERALLALAVVALLSPGLNVNASLLLLAAAAGVYAGDTSRWLPARGVAAAFLMLPLLLRWPVGLLASAVGATLLLEKVAPRLRVWPAIFAVLAALAATGRPLGAPLGAPLEALLLAAALLPAAFAALREERWRVAAGLLLVFGAACLGKDPESWAAGALLLALCVPCERPAGSAQRVYLLILLAWGLALAAFPWLRPEPIREIAQALAPSAPYFLAAALLLVPVPGWLSEVFAKRYSAASPALRHGPAIVAALGFFAWLLYALPPAGLLLLAGQPQSLVAARPRLRLEIAHFPFRQVIVDSQLFHGAELAPGQEVAALRFLGADGGELLVLPLRAGDDTADWAAGRADLERRPDFRAPSAWLSQVAPDGTFFSGRFRRRFELPQKVDAVAVELVRAAGMPERTQIALHELELRP